MKGTLRWVYATLILAASIFALSACSTDDTDKPSGPKEFPTFSDISVRVGDTGFIEFKADGTWTLSSSKPTWFKLASDTGKAGDQKIGYTITDDGLGFEDDEAIITFSYKGMDDKSATFKATRTAGERFLKLYKFDADISAWSEVESLDLEYSISALTYTVGYMVVTNYNWKVTTPEWISIKPDDTSGKANPNVNPIETPTAPSIKTSWIEINLAKATADPMTGKFTFTDLNAATESITANVTCPGSTEYMLPDPGAAFTVAMNAEGKYVTKKIVDGEEVEVLHETYEFSLMSGNDNVTLFKVWKENGWYGADNGMGNLTYEATWCGIDPTNRGKVIGPAVKEFGYEIWCQEVGDVTRVATVIAIPKAKAAGLTAEDLVDGEGKEIKPEFQQYIVFELTQEATVGLTFAYGAPQGITLAKMAEGDELDGIKGEHGVQMAYTITFDSFEQLNLAMLKVLGVDMSTLELQFVPAEAELTSKSGWLGMENGEVFTLKFSNEYAPFTSSRSALMIFKFAGVPMLALKVVQNVTYTAPAPDSGL